MTVQEFSDSFDTLINSFGTPVSITFDEYEKSIFLTKAQEQLVISLYSGKNVTGDTFESSEEVRSYLHSLIRGYSTNTPYTTTDTDTTGLDTTGLDVKIIVYPENLWFIIEEALTVKDDICHKDNGRFIQVQPVSYDEYHKIRRNPFRGINNNRAIRLDEGNSDLKRRGIILSKDSILTYQCKYVSKPDPIILTNLESEGLSINGKTTITQSCLPDSLHEKLLEIAVQLALQSRNISNNNS